MELWKKIGIVIVLAIIGVAGLAIISSPQHRCYVWRNVEEKVEINGIPNVAISDQPLSMLLPVDNETYSYVTPNQSYNFYCQKSIWHDWICHRSYECEEIG